MKISELIERLVYLQGQNGDIHVVICDNGTTEYVTGAFLIYERTKDIRKLIEITGVPF